MAAGLGSTQVGFAGPVLASEATSNLNSNQPDIKAIFEQAEKLRTEGKYGAAVNIWRQLMPIIEKNFGIESPTASEALYMIASLLDKSGRTTDAETYYRRHLKLQKKLLGSIHPEVSKALLILSFNLEDQLKYTAAENARREALFIDESLLGSNDLGVATTLTLLAYNLNNQGRYNDAEQVFRRALAIEDLALGQDSQKYATSLNYLAGLLKRQGRLDEADYYYSRSLSTREKLLGPSHPDTATTLNDLTLVKIGRGRHLLAEELLLQSLEIFRKEIGAESQQFANALSNLAVVSNYLGKYAEAEKMLRQSLLINEKNLGPENAGLAATINNLGLLMQELGRYPEAESLLKRSLIINEKNRGPNHPETANSLNNLGVLLSDQGRHAAANLLYRRSLAIESKSSNNDYLRMGSLYANMSREHAIAGQYSEALMLITKSLAMEFTWLTREAPPLPSELRSKFLDQLSQNWQIPFGWIESHPPAAELALNTRLNRQGLLLEIEQRQGLLLNSPGVDQAKVEQLQALTQQLASVSLPPEHRAAARDQRDRLQSELYRQIPELQIQLVTPLEVAKALPADGVLVEFQRYRSWDGRKPKNQRWGEAQYIALVLKPSGSISSMPLGPAAAIEATVHKGLSASAEDLTDAEAVWAQLSNQVLKPLLPQLSGSRQWFLSPDGELNRVPFAALPAPQQPSTPLAKVVQLRLLTTGRELVRLQQPAPPSTAALVMANPSYDRANAKPTPATRPDTDTNGAQRRSAELGSSRWNPLPATQREGQQVASLLGSGLISGAAATTTSLQRQKGPALLHIASHGFFVADSEKEPARPLLALQDQSTLLWPLRGEDPQLRSGLVFAGANQPDADPNDDGYLTAAEAVNLNLKGTQLVVLSACSTGQGDVRTGEGVYGLQRSLTVAGARSTLLSLWKVDDAATAEFMSRFYKRLKAGEGRADALAAVQSEFRSGAVRGPGGEDWSPPYYWAAWQLVGDWRPIQGL
ncbi:CHAT domain-containing tetratricopeptide repeat protein [Synechococcus sp. CBW1108]|uniref:CHAT domain-containing tetratricopeptide repeat protein n=1 Tax=Synechococcus sp. CBW1108 TaxID=1353147 RepID=UPI0018CEF3EE|nr:CHAT domain-containing tetratricopeptide repeat protein [Synechococcus sp. CBW1108]QPN70008.1 CHAT domain-containing protein [Synechococcus sp. CBW1108]